ncbi:hypothetical protein FOXB_02703 [Fusarium oxysporum f. sp. conglutinans Fo5176]|uniref:Uncharacterized protein n=1 Tax=Fusarium oxysporum (strain Fo5176) TaxID=660025 RepID=F9F8H8_FUSOF|nr:hypothetical protein FOXB_02703 [Fusarium oxysporum f. sp. conglutinans Fo5176]
MAATKHLIADSEDAVDNRPVKKTKVMGTRIKNATFRCLFGNEQMSSTNRARHFKNLHVVKVVWTNKHQLRISSRSLQATRENGPISSRKH